MNHVPPVTEEELEILYVPQLRKLGEYYGLELPSRMLKADIIDAVIEAAKIPKHELLPGQVRRSARVQRIYEANKEK